MDCKEARQIIREWGETTIRGKEAMGSSGDEREAFNHIRECSNKECHQLWHDFNGVISGLEKIDLLVGKDGLLPFSY